jgi:AcrR family transcriptional regulator
VEEKRARDPEATRRRIIGAALAEFAEFGFSGARIARIASKARANKQLIYAYFGDKEELFSIVINEAFSGFFEETPFDGVDIPEWVGTYYDYFAQNEHLVRLILWERLERHAFNRHIDFAQRQVEAIEQGQREGFITRRIAATDLAALLRQITTAWAVSSQALQSLAPASDQDAHAAHRAAAIEAARRLIEPEVSNEA